jgi:hypothetical protein
VATYAVGQVQCDADLLTVSMAAVLELNGANACQHTMVVRDNVVDGARSCVTPAPGECERRKSEPGLLQRISKLRHRQLVLDCRR